MQDKFDKYFKNYKSFTKFVMTSEMFVTEFAHSGVLSPITTLTPDFRNEYGKRRKALQSLIDQMDHYPVAQRAVVWIADYDHEPTLRQMARRALGLPEWDGNLNVPSWIVKE